MYQKYPLLVTILSNGNAEAVAVGRGNGAPAFTPRSAVLCGGGDGGRPCISHATTKPVTGVCYNGSTIGGGDRRRSGGGGPWAPGARWTHWSRKPHCAAAERRAAGRKQRPSMGGVRGPLGRVRRWSRSPPGGPSWTKQEGDVKRPDPGREGPGGGEEGGQGGLPVGGQALPLHRRQHHPVVGICGRRRTPRGSTVDPGLVGIPCIVND